MCSVNYYTKYVLSITTLNVFCQLLYYMCSLNYYTKCVLSITILKYVLSITILIVCSVNYYTKCVLSITILHVFSQLLY